MGFGLHPRDKIVPEQIDIGGNSNDVLAQVGKNCHARHCIWREIQKMESIDHHHGLEEIQEGREEAANEICTEKSVGFRVPADP